MRYTRKYALEETFKEHATQEETKYPILVRFDDTNKSEGRKEMSHFTAIYDVDDLATPTKILSNLFDISQVYKMFVDDVEVTPTANYQFGSTGKHKVKCQFLKLTSCENMFHGCTDLYEIDLNHLDTSKVTTMKRMFRGVTEDNSSIVDMKLHKIDCECIDTSNVTDMSCMFQLCCNVKNFKLGNFNTSKVTTMNRMFQGQSTNIMLTESTDVSGWDMSNVTDIANMFAYNIKLKRLDVSNWDTSNIKYADCAFIGYTGYEMNLEELDTSKWNLSKLETSMAMFQCCTKLETLDTSNWNCTNLKDSTYMFTSCKNIKQLNVTNWKLPNNCNNMFGSCYALEEIIGIENADASNVITANYMFCWCMSLKKLDIPNWNVSNCTSLYGFTSGLHNCEYIDIRNWNLSKCTNIAGLFNICASNTTIPESLIRPNNPAITTIYMNNVVPPTTNTDFEQIIDVPTSTNVYLPSAYKTQWQSIIAEIKNSTAGQPTYYLQDSQIIWV